LASFDHLVKSVTLPHFAATKETYPTNIFELIQSLSKLLSVQLEQKEVSTIMFHVVRNYLSTMNDAQWERIMHLP
jgi:hypothetical protein